MARRHSSAWHRMHDEMLAARAEAAALEARAMAPMPDEALVPPRPVETPAEPQEEIPGLLSTQDKHISRADDRARRVQTGDFSGD